MAGSIVGAGTSRAPCVASHWKEGAVHHSATTLTLVRNHWEAQLKDNGNHGTVEYHGISYYIVI
jgi:hypothetical protein